MRLCFKKSNDDISVELVENDRNQEFTYSLMVRSIHQDKMIEDPIIEGDFTELEVRSINEIIESLRKVIKEAEIHDNPATDNQNNF